MNTRDHIQIRGKPILHATARRDWVCGTCGGALKTIFDDGWKTVCARDASHPADGFTHKSSWAYVEHKRIVEAAQAQDVFDHLPAELQGAILGEET